MGTSYGQKAIGIGTQNPRTTLEVAGDVIIADQLEVTQKENMQDGDLSTFLVQTNDNQIETLDVSNPTGAALGYIQKYVIENPNGDWVKDFDTQVNATDFVMISISAYYDKELVISGNDTSNGSAPYTSAFIKDGTWHLIADFPVVSNRNSSEQGSWTFTTLIYSKDLIKQLGTLNIPMNEQSEAAANAPIID